MNGKNYFRRRDILKLIATVPAAAISSVPAVTQAVSPQLPSGGGSVLFEPKTLNPQEWKTVRALCEIIIPADQGSGSAVQAGVPEFIDDWLDFEGGELATQIRGGLAWLDRESSRLFASDFVDCSPAQQSQLLDRIAYPNKAAAEDAGAVAFFNRLRDLVVAGFFTSETGIRDLPYLGNEPRSEWSGCPPEALAKLGIVKG
jgi:gluconate 2-dehydrogenase gamma chain